MSRRWLLVLIAGLATLFTAMPVLAGGWAVISLDSLPQEIIAGEPVTVGFTVLQHGRTPMAGLNPVIHLTNATNGNDISVYPKEEGSIGHYTGTFILSEVGNWNWSVQAFTMEQPMPELVVTKPVSQTAASNTNSLLETIPGIPFGIGVTGTVIVALGLISLLRRRSRWAAAAIVVGLLVCVVGFARIGSAVASWRASASNQQEVSVESDELIQTGENLFVVKGCLTCHINRRVDPSYMVFSTEIGPNLTNFKSSPEYLHLWLSDPAAIKPETQMPNLGLSQAEIETLSSFLLQDGTE